MMGHCHLVCMYVENLLCPPFPCVSILLYLQGLPFNTIFRFRKSSSLNNNNSISRVSPVIYTHTHTTRTLGRPRCNGRPVQTIVQVHIILYSRPGDDDDKLMYTLFVLNQIRAIQGIEIIIIYTFIKAIARKYISPVGNIQYIRLYYLQDLKYCTSILLPINNVFFIRKFDNLIGPLNIFSIHCT